MTKAEFKGLRGNEEFLVSWKGLRPFKLKNFAGGCAFGWFKKDGESEAALHRVPWTLLKIKERESKDSLLEGEEAKKKLLCLLEETVRQLRRELGD